MPLHRLILEADTLPTNFLAAWSLPILPFLGLALALFLYMRGWQSARLTRSAELPYWRALCFLAGVAAFWIAIASPIDALDDYLLAAHMIQHFILMSVAPPLIVLGAPTVPILRGLPRFLLRFPLGPLLSARWFHAVVRFITHPGFAWLAMNVSYLSWHTPRLFELTFASETIHDFEHLCFFATSLLFWWVVIAPWPSQPRWPRWTVIPYLLAADLVNTILSATLAFSGKVLYPSYALAPRIYPSLDPLKDQIAAGAEMWVMNSMVMLIPAVILIVHLLRPRAFRANSAAPGSRASAR